MTTVVTTIATDATQTVVETDEDGGKITSTPGEAVTFVSGIDLSAGLDAKDADGDGIVDNADAADGDTDPHRRRPGRHR